MKKANGSSNKQKPPLTNQLSGLPVNPDELAPDVLNEWKNYIAEFERQYEANKTIQVYERIGRPSFISAESLDAISLGKELQRLLQLLESFNLEISTLCPVEDSTMYRFITEELFHYEMENVTIPGMITYFCYEAFHPNHEYDLRHYTEDGILHLLSNEEEYWMLAFKENDFYSSEGMRLPDGLLIQKIHWFKECFEWFHIHELKDIQVEFNLETGKAHTTFYVDYSACPYDESPPLRYKGNGFFSFDYCCEDWFINRLQLPGLVIS